MSKFALFAGSNFLGTPNQLAGCVNDVINVRARAEAAGFTTLADLRDHAMTTVAWKAALTAAAACAQPGDIVLHMHSHHGAQIQDPDEPNGLAEVWCPDDFDWSPEKMIEDKWMGALVASLAPGVLWVDWADCCHAGDSLRTLWGPGERPRYIPNPALKSWLGDFLSRPMVVAGPDRRGILLAACRSNQTSADTVLDGQPCGAFTGKMLASGALALQQTYHGLMAETTEALALGGYDQRPELDCPTGGDQLIAFAEPVIGKGIVHDYATLDPIADRLNGVAQAALAIPALLGLAAETLLTGHNQFGCE